MIRIRVNGKDKLFEPSDGTAPLIDALHERLGLTGTKLACGIGICRACTVAVRRHPEADLQPALACSTPLDWFDGAEVMTIEGVTPAAGGFDPVQRAFLDSFAFQCGYCTPGFVIEAVILMERLRHSPVPAAAIPDTVEAAIGQHVCRCTGYAGYYRALEGLIAKTQQASR